MNEQSNKPLDNEDIPESLRRGKKEPFKEVQFRIPLSWWLELTSFAREFDQDVAVFLREAIEDWLRRARKVRQKSPSGEYSRKLSKGW